MRGFSFPNCMTNFPLITLSPCFLCSKCVLCRTYLHHRFVFHLDLKAENVLVSNDHKDFKITDFGLSFKHARGEGAGSSSNTPRGGTFWYLPPEALFRTPQDTDSKKKARDVYAYGCLVCEIATEQLAFEDTMQERKKNFYTPLDSMSSEFAPLDEVVSACTHNEPKKRPSLEEILDMLVPSPSS